MAPPTSPRTTSLAPRASTWTPTRTAATHSCRPPIWPAGPVRCSRARTPTGTTRLPPVSAPHGTCRTSSTCRSGRVRPTTAPSKRRSWMKAPSTPASIGRSVTTGRAVRRTTVRAKPTTPTMQSPSSVGTITTTRATSERGRPETAPSSSATAGERGGARAATSTSPLRRHLRSRSRLGHRWNERVHIGGDVQLRRPVRA